MRFLMSLTAVAVVIVVWAKMCVYLGRWHMQRMQRPAHDRRLPRQRSYAPLPDGHRPPPGLGPLSPSERFLTQEAARGMRDLERFLVDQQAA